MESTIFATDFECPKCGAAPGAPCVGQVSAHHLERINATKCPVCGRLGGRHFTSCVKSVEGARVGVAVSAIHATIRDALAAGYVVTLRWTGQQVEVTRATR